jgi:hypothetical protein
MVLRGIKVEVVKPIAQLTQSRRRTSTLCVSETPAPARFQFVNEH